MLKAWFVGDSQVFPYVTSWVHGKEQRDRTGEVPPGTRTGQIARRPFSPADEESGGTARKSTAPRRAASRRKDRGRKCWGEVGLRALTVGSTDPGTIA